MRGKLGARWGEASQRCLLGYACRIQADVSAWQERTLPEKRQNTWAHNPPAQWLDEELDPKEILMGAPLYPSWPFWGKSSPKLLHAYKEGDGRGEMSGTQGSSSPEGWKQVVV